MFSDLIVSELARPALEAIVVAFATLLTALTAIAIRYVQKKAKVEDMALMQEAERQARQIADVAVEQAEQAFEYGDNANKKAFAKEQVQRGLGDLAKKVGKGAVSLLWGRVDGMVESGVRKLERAL